MAVTPNSVITPQTPRSAVVNTAAAQNTFPPTTAPSNTVLLVTAGPNGSRVTRVRSTPQTTITACHSQLFRSNDAGVTKFYVHGVLIPATTVDTTHQATPTDFGYSDDNPLNLGANERLYIAASLSTSINHDCDLADY